MSKKTYDEDDLSRVANMVAEKIEDRIDLLEENMETLIERKVRPIVREELDYRLDPIKSDIKVIKSAVKETNRDLHKLEGRVTKLEAVSHSHA